MKQRWCLLMVCLVLVLSGCSQGPRRAEVAAAVEATLTAMPTPVVCTEPGMKVAGPACGAFSMVCPTSWQMYKDVGYEVSFNTDDGSVIVTGAADRLPGDPGPGADERLLWWLQRMGHSDETLLSACRREIPGGEILSISTTYDIGLFDLKSIYQSVWCDVGDGGVFATQMLNDDDALSDQQRETFFAALESIAMDPVRMRAVDPFGSVDGGTPTPELSEREAERQAELQAELQAAVEATVVAVLESATATPTPVPMAMERATPTPEPLMTPEPLHELQMASGAFSLSCPESWQSVFEDDGMMQLEMPDAVAMFRVVAQDPARDGMTVDERLDELARGMLGVLVQDMGPETALLWAEKVPCDDADGSWLVSVGLRHQSVDDEPMIGQYCIYAVEGYEVWALHEVWPRTSVTTAERCLLPEALISLELDAEVVAEVLAASE